MNFFPALPISIARKAGSDGRKAAHQAVQSGALVVALKQYEEVEEILKPHAAERAKIYMRQAAEHFDLTPRQQVNLFTIYLYSYINGAWDTARKQTHRHKR